MTATPNLKPQLLENGTQPNGMVRRVVDIWRYRELLMSLVRRELKVRYKGSVLGFVWTLLNPLLYLVVFTIAFKILGSGIPKFGLFLLSGLLVFNLFTVGVTSATTSISGNGPLVQKVWFPREILPLASIGSNLITFLCQMVILMVGLVVFNQPPEWSMLWLAIPAIFITLMLAVGLGLFLAALNVYFRDVQHFLELAFLALFWLTPIVYELDKQVAGLVGDPAKGTEGLAGARFGETAERFAMINPLTPIVTVFQRIFYNPTNSADATNLLSRVLNTTQWHLGNLLISFVIASFTLVLGFKMFNKLEANLAEEL